MKAMISKKACLSFARRIYVDKESIKSVAKSDGCAERTMAIRIRTAVPALISEQGWTVRDVMEHCGGASVPKEMRKEVVGLHKTHGVTRTVEMTGVPAATMARWGNGKRPGRGQLSMGGRTWARLGGSAPCPCR